MDMQVHIYEQQGQISRMKAQQIAQTLIRFYEQATPELRAEIDRKAEELRAKREVISCQSGTTSQDMS